MSVEHWLAFVAASVVLLVIPGPTILSVISYSLAHGRRARWPLVAAVALGDCTALCVSLLGLGALLAASAFWFTVVKWAGGGYLLYLGIRMLRTGAAGGAVARRIVRAGVALAAVRQYLAGDGAESQGHGVLRRLPAAIHRTGRRYRQPIVDPGNHLRDAGGRERRPLRAVRRRGQPLAGVAARAARLSSGGRLAAVDSGNLGIAGPQA